MWHYYFFFFLQSSLKICDQLFLFKNTEGFPEAGEDRDNDFSQFLMVFPKHELWRFGWKPFICLDFFKTVSLKQCLCGNTLFWKRLMLSCTSTACTATGRFFRFDTYSWKITRMLWSILRSSIYVSNSTATKAADVDVTSLICFLLLLEPDDDAKPQVCKIIKLLEENNI